MSQFLGMIYKNIPSKVYVLIYVIWTERKLKESIFKIHDWSMIYCSNDHWLINYLAVLALRLST